MLPGKKIGTGIVNLMEGQDPESNHATEIGVASESQSVDFSELNGCPTLSQLNCK